MILDEFFSLTAPRTTRGVRVHRPPPLDFDEASTFSESTCTFSCASRFPTVEEKYFGLEARLKFFDRLQFMRRQRNILHSRQTDETKGLNFDNEDLECTDFPHSVCSKPSSPALDDTRYFESLECEESGSLTSGTFKSSCFEEEFPEPGASIEAPLTPRTRFISECLRENINPRASLVIRKKFCHTVNLQHLGIGDRIALIFAECLRDLPFVSILNINNNNLTDAGVEAILSSIRTLPMLHTLNLSRNKMDDAASDALADYVQSQDCPLQTLTMQCSDIDDFEGERFVRQLFHNHSITELDLSENKIGHAETQRSTTPGLVTCSEALAQLLAENASAIKSLNLSWNLIRLQGCEALCHSLATNHSLVFLDLSYNSVGTSGGETIGDALMENRTLQELLLANSGISSTSCFPIAMGAIENKALTRLVLDNNPIGEKGSLVLMVVPMSAGERVKISVNNCNMRIEDPTCWFSFADPLGAHCMDLSRPYERAVAMALLDMAANHSTYVIAKCEYENASGRKDTVELQQIITTDILNYLPEKQKAVYDRLCLMQAAVSDVDRGRQLFEQVDLDGSGEIDRSELKELLESLGITVTSADVDDFMMQYCSDDSELIGLSEFLAFLKNQASEASARIADMAEVRVMAATAFPTVKYIPPREGKLHVEVIDGFSKKKNYRVIRSNQTAFFAKSGLASALKFVLEHSKLRYNEAMSIYRTLYAEGMNSLTALSMLAQQLDSPVECKKLILKITEGCRAQWSRLRTIMGPALGVVTGMYNGYYDLDLSSDMDRLCLRKLLEHDIEESRARQALSPVRDGLLGDLSQRGNWSCFRNAYLNYKPFVISLEAFQPMLQSGRLVFDYASTSRPSPEQEVLYWSDKKCIRFLTHNLFLLDESNSGKAMGKLRAWSKQIAAANDVENPKFRGNEKSRAIGAAQALEEFYEHQVERPEYVALGLKVESPDYVPPKGGETVRLPMVLAAVPPAHPAGPAASSKGKAKASSKGGKSSKKGGGAPLAVDVPASETDSLPAATSPKPTSTAETTITLTAYSVNSAGSVTPGPHRYAGGRRKGRVLGADATAALAATPAGKQQVPQASVKLEGMAREKKNVQDRKRYLGVLNSSVASVAVKSAAIIQRLVTNLESGWIFCRQLGLILECFDLGRRACRFEYSGSYHVELIVQLFPRILDIENLEVVLQQLSPRDVGALYGRLGILYLVNPLKLEGYWTLNVARSEERLVFKMLLTIGLIEPGENLAGCFVQVESSRSSDEPLSGKGKDGTTQKDWMLTNDMAEEEGCPTVGTYSCRLLSSHRVLGGRRNNLLRRALLWCTLISEESLCLDQCNIRGVAKLTFDQEEPYLASDNQFSTESERCGTALVPSAPIEKFDALEMADIAARSGRGVVEARSDYFANYFIRRASAPG